MHAIFDPQSLFVAVEEDGLVEVPVANVPDDATEQAQLVEVRF